VCVYTATCVDLNPSLGASDFLDKHHDTLMLADKARNAALLLEGTSRRQRQVC
jgi:hypothetical protein